MLTHPGPAPLLQATAPGTGAALRVLPGSRPALGYYCYQPAGSPDSGRVLVTVHGVSRNAEEHIALFRPLADHYRTTLVAPFFTHENFRDYQRLGRKGLGPRADLALIRVLNEIGMRTGIDTGRVDLFGFSGGAQFVHRFAFAHSQRVRSLALGAAGWYTMPDRDQHYPYGIADAGGLDAVRLNASAAAGLRTLVLVGELDDRDDDEELNRSRLVTRTQGHHRVARARTWTRAMNRLAGSLGMNRCAELVVLPGVGHSFREAVCQGGLAQRVFQHCYGGGPVAHAPADW